MASETYQIQFTSIQAHKTHTKYQVHLTLCHCLTCYTLSLSLDSLCVLSPDPTSNETRYLSTVESNCWPWTHHSGKDNMTTSSLVTFIVSYSSWQLICHNFIVVMCDSGCILSEYRWFMKALNVIKFHPITSSVDFFFPFFISSLSEWCTFSQYFVPCCLLLLPLFELK